MGALVAYADWIYQLGQQPDRQSDFNGLVSYVVSLAGPLVLTSRLPSGTSTFQLSAVTASACPPGVMNCFNASGEVHRS